MWRIVLEWLKEYAEVIGLVLTLAGGVYSFFGAMGIIVCVVLFGLATLVYSLYKVFKELRSKIEALRQDLQCRDEALSQAEAKSQEDSRRIEELRSQIETLQQELQRKSEALSQSEAKAHEDSRLITELRSQTEAQQKELQRKDEALSQSAAKSQEDSRRITELRSQIEALQQEKAKKKIPPMSDNDFLKLCEAGNAKKVEEAIMNGANVNAKDNDGWTALMYAAWNGHTDTAELLLKNRAYVNAKTNKGRTALWFATWNGHTDTAGLLCKYGGVI